MGCRSIIATSKLAKQIRHWIDHPFQIGHGKNSLTAVAEEVATERGRRIVLISVDPAHSVLDIFPEREQSIDAEVENLIEARNAARKARNFAESDKIRADLLAGGIILEDKPDGTTIWRRA